MWFDPQEALRRLGGGEVSWPDPVPRVAQVACVARPHPSKSDIFPGKTDATNTRKPAPSDTRVRDALELRGNFPLIKRADNRPESSQDDVVAYLAALSLHGPMTYGAAAVALGWGVTRAWVAEAALVADGRAIMTREGRTSTNTS